MRKKYLGTVLVMSMVSSLLMTEGLTSNTKMVKASEIENTEEDTRVIYEDLIYSEENYKNEFAPDRVIVSVKKDDEEICAESIFDGIDMKDVRQFANCKTPGEVGGDSAENSLYLVTLNDEGRENVLDAIQTLKDNPGVEYAEPDYVVEPDEESNEYAYNPNDPEVVNQWDKIKMDAPLAWNVTTGSKEVVVGVVDSGIDIYHPDLVGNLWTNEGEIPYDNIDNDGNGFVDDVHGWNFHDNTNDLADIGGHGTSVSGVIGMSGNNWMGGCGVNWNVSIAVLRYSSGTGYVSDTVSAVQYANAMGIGILNHSYGLTSFSQSQYDAFKEAGLNICSAGNDKADTDVVNHFPSNFDLDNVISVAATDNNDKLVSWFSNYGATTVDLAAPGEKIYTTKMQCGYGTSNGTSMAAPEVTGSVALVKSLHPDYSYAQLKAAILNNVDKVDALDGKVLTGGRLNVAKALGAVTKFHGVEYKDVYNYSYYKNAYNDIYYTKAPNPIEALKHFVYEGMGEGRQGSLEFDPITYSKRYSELKEQFGENWKEYYLHYINTGKDEGKSGKKDIMLGDINGDGKLTTADLREMTYAMRYYSMGQSEGTNWYKAEADLDGDGDIDQDDYKELEMRVNNVSKPVSLLGDVDKNGVINNGDLMSMQGVIRSYNMGKAEGNPIYLPEADLDRDGDNDMDDYALLKNMI